MSPAPVRRKLAAILAADAVGYSRMMAADEEGTLRILAAHRAVIDGIIQFHEGRIVNTAGDSVLAEFASPTQAVRCAVEIQDALKTRNDALPEEQRLHFRIGVNLGDVMVKGEDLLGDGVNVAARLESIAEPGGIYVSSSVYDQIAGKLDLGFVDLGEQSLKNIERPVRAYRVERDKSRVARAVRRRRRRSGPWLAAALGIAVLGAGGAWYWVEHQSAAHRIDEAKARAEAAAARARADAEIARARAEAEEAKKTASAASAAAEASKRALEEQRLADERARAQRDLAAARAEADAARRRADAEVAAAARRAADERRAAEAEAERRKAERAQAAAAEARAAAEVLAAKPPAKPAVAAAGPSYGGPWAGVMRCPGATTMPATGVPLAVTASATGFEVRRGESGQPGALQMAGTVQADGRLQLAGSGVSRLPDSFGKTFAAAVQGTLADGKYEGSGRVGAYDCSVAFERTTAAHAQAVAAAASALPGATASESRWSARFTCEAFKKQPEQSYPAGVTLAGSEFTVRRGQDEQPGSIRLKGVRAADGTLRLEGRAYHPVTGQQNRGEFEGRFQGERYEGSGRLGARSCSLTISRR